METEIKSEITLLENEIKGESYKTELYKNSFINEIRGDLGIRIKTIGGSVSPIKVSFIDKLKKSLIKFFKIL